ncbi:hypothetical protein HQ571_04895 [Candidatus Kuenenbacteria bacterium]|nr:hypothetical protein [Candidatus Kuenenbacteria bacterium]
MMYTQQSPDHSNYNQDNATKIFQKKTEDEIILWDYVKVLGKRKWVIISSVIIITLGAVIINLLLPKTFESSALINVGSYKNAKLENMLDLQIVLNTENMLELLSAELSLPDDIDPTSLASKFDIEKEKKDKVDSGFVKVTGRGQTPEQSVQLVKSVNSLIIKRHDQLFKEANKSFELEIETITRSQEKTKIDITEIEANINRLNKDAIFYMTEIEKRSLVDSEGQGRIVEAYIMLLAQIKMEIEVKEKQLADLNLRLLNYDVDFQKKEFEKKYETKPTSVEMAPVLPKTKIAPNRRKNVMLSFIFSLLFGIFLAFSYEYCKQNIKKRALNKFNNKAGF